MGGIAIVGSSLAFEFNPALAIFASLFFLRSLRSFAAIPVLQPGTVVFSIPSFLRLLCLFAALPSALTFASLREILSSVVRRLSVDDRNREAVIPFAAHGLNGGRGNPFFLCEQLKETTHADNAGVFTFGIGDRSLTDYIIRDDKRARPRQFQRPKEVIGGVNLICVDKDEIKRRDPFGGQYGQQI
jgi:hypothetical protein